jgi:hypothetical protein
MYSAKTINTLLWLMFGVYALAIALFTICIPE